MIIQITNQSTGEVINISLPCNEKMIQSICDNFLYAENTAFTEVHVMKVLENVKANVLLQNRQFKLDELNLFTKCLERLDKNELATFYASAYGINSRELKEFINLSFNTQSYSVVADFSNLDKLGKSLWLKEQGAMSMEVFEAIDGQEYIQNMMESQPSPMVTPYGIVYRNANELQMMYNGKCSPPVLWGENPITVCLNTKLDRDFLYLPVQKSEVTKALQRLGISCLSDCEMEIEDYNLPENMENIIFQELKLDSLNELAKSLKEIGDGEHDYLSKLVAYTKVNTVPELKILLNCWQEFEMFDHIHTPLAYGTYMICDSGHFEYDSNLEDYVDFKRYGEENVALDKGVFTEKGYILYQGFNSEMINILRNNLGMNCNETQQISQLPAKEMGITEEIKMGGMSQ